MKQQKSILVFPAASWPMQELNQMQEAGWRIVDITATASDNMSSYLVTLERDPSEVPTVPPTGRLLTEDAETNR